MANYANQLTIKLNLSKTIRVKKETNNKNEKEEMFAPWVYWKYKKAAMKKLTGNGYKFWEYLYSWAGEGHFNLSPKRITEETGISDRGLRNARQELESFHCLTLEEGKNNIYIFTPDAIL